MTNPHGTPVWYELLTCDPEAAQSFYADVVGWTVATGGYPGMDYRIISAPDGEAIAGLMKMPDDMGGGPIWLHYIGVDDVDRAVQKIVAGGGAVYMPAMNMAGVGRMAMVADPQSAGFYVMRGSSGEDSSAFQQGDEATPGHAVWNELTAADPNAALAFYADQFGWRQEGAMPMPVLSDAEGGELGDYRFIHSGKLCLGALMGRVPNGRDGWQFYFMVPDIDAAVERARAGGGKLIQGPDEIPGGDFSVNLEDPQGARFGLVGPRTKEQ